MMNKWFTRYLYGVENGVEREPKAWIVRESDRASSAPGRADGAGRATPPPVPYDDYPNPAAKQVTFIRVAGGGRIGGLTLDNGVARARETLVDNVEFGGAALASRRDFAAPTALRHAGIDSAVHISGTPRISYGWPRASRRQICRSGWWCCPGPRDRSVPPT